MTRVSQGVLRGRSSGPSEIGRAKRVNLGDAQRWVSMAAGAAMIGLGLTRRTPLGLLTALAGGYLAYRGYTGHCAVCQAMGTGEAPAENPQPSRAIRREPSMIDGDVVTEASDESFPASDPPAWTGVSEGGRANG